MIASSKRVTLVPAPLSAVVMSARASVLVVATILLLLQSVPVMAAPSAPDWDAEPFTIVGETWLSDRLLKVEYSTPRLNPPAEVLEFYVLVPNGWEEASGHEYPVLYLLHGATARASRWTDPERHFGWPTSLEDFTYDKDVVLVMPDGGTEDASGWYSDWFNDGAFGAPEWETHHLVQLMNLIERRFPVRTDRNGRALAGFSMGGFGAMKYAARHPELFAAAFSMSGALDVAALGAAGSLPAELDAAGPRSAFGPFATEEVRWRANNPLDLAENLRDTVLFVQHGDGLPGGPSEKDSDPLSLAQEALVRPQNEDFHERLTELAIPHEYVFLPQTGHNWYYIHEGLQTRAWPILERVFARPPSSQPPPRWTYKSAERVFRAWGFDVERLDGPMEFLEMAVDEASRQVTVVGAGSVRLHTPPWFDPTGGKVDVLVGGVPFGDSMAANADGRVTVDISLGPPHDFQQYTPEAALAESLDADYWRSASIQFAQASDPDPDPDPVADESVDSPEVGSGPSPLPATGGGAVLFAALLGLAASALRRGSQV